MKLIKFIAAVALVASTSLISDGNATAADQAQAIAGVCPNWPYCRDVDFSEQATDTPQHLTINALRKAV
ncbi:hypothetical protein EIK76_06345 [Rheinheimera mesophila]|uniref:Uncharacterized protein n=1 Tax=Rheinheimera mesophila TaxID=1547515 RepID=A0A3P3QTM5_9GAMM|nr:hypothetical protein [Rheinheimera mesophila]KKL03368.1 hypothetical protein SD53_01080 [Rheinheimera mesophila]RRJ23673.1 hypothetical protein EIK76_06345 [Rheinheimera mesophila]